MKKTKSNPDASRLRVLILEDNPTDAELVERELQRAGINFTSRLVEGKREFNKALADFQPRVILSDFKLPKFDGLAALETTRQLAPDTPFIFVSGSIGEEQAIETLAQGASDYIFKDNLQRLGPAVKRVVEAARLKLEKKKTDEDLRLHVDGLRLLAEAADRFVHINDLDEIYDYLTKVISEISEADYLMLTLYDEKLQAVRPKIITGFEPFRETIHRRFHVDFMQMVFYLKDMRRDDFSDFVSRRLLPVRDGLYGLANRKLPRPLCRTIEKLLAIDVMFTMGFSWENHLYGGLTVLFKKGNKLKNHAQIEALLNQAAVAIKRLLAEKSLRASEEHLRQSEEYYRTLVETSPDAIFIIDAGGRVTFASPKTHEIFGIPVQIPIIGTSILDFIEPKEIPRVQERMVEILSGRSLPQINEYRLLRQDRRPFWGEISPSPLRDAAGRSIALLLVCRDVSERKRAETIQQIQYKIANAVATAETFFSLGETVRKELSALLDTTNFLITLYDEASGMLFAPFEKDEKDAIPQWPAEKSLTGLVLKQKRSMLLRGKEIQQLDQAGTTEQIGSNAEAWLGVPLQINEKMLGAIVVQSYDNADAYDQSSINILEMIANQLSVYIERKGAEAELLQQKAFLEKLVESAPEGIAITDCPGLVLQVNSEFERMFGYEAKEVIGKKIDDLVVPPEYLEEAGTITHSVGAGKTNVLETVRKRKDGTLFNVSIIGAPICIAERQVAVYAIYRDISDRKEAEEALLREKAFLEQLVESAPEAIALGENDGRILRINSEFCRLFGYKEKEVLGKNIDDLISSAEKKSEAVSITQTVGKGKKSSLETVRRRKNGKPIDVSLIGSPIIIDGQQVATYGIYRDISERKRAEEQIHYQADLLQNVSDAIIATDKNNNIQAWNKAAENIYGWKAEETIGKKLHDVIIPEYRYQSRKEVIEKLDKEGAWSGEIIHHHRDGNPFTVQSSIKILKDAAGDEAGMVSVNHDISERKVAEEALRESHTRFQLANRATFNPIWDWNLQTDMLWWNENFQLLFGYQANEIEPGIESWTSRIHPEDLDRVVKGIHSAIDSGRESWSDQYRFHKKDGSYADIADRGLISRDSNGKPTRMIGAMEDISERNRAEEKIRASLKEKEVLLQEIHHRVKNNLQIISGLLTLQAEQSAGKSLDEIFSESQDRIRSIALIHEKLYRSQNLAEIAFDEYLRTLIENLFLSHGVAAGRVTAKYEMESISFTIEKAIPLGLIVNELVTNALKHAFPAGRQGEIRIGLHGYKGAKSYALKTDSGTLHCVPTCELIIADNGVGLPAGQVPKEQKTLGMNLVSMLAKQIQAELKVKTGPGTEFRLLFPGLPAGSNAEDQHKQGGA